MELSRSSAKGVVEGANVSIDSIPIATLIYDLTDYRILRANASAAALYGYPLSELCTLNLHDIVVDSVSLRASVETRTTDHDFRGRYLNRTKSGAVFEVEAAGHDLVYANRPARVALIRRRLDAEPRAADPGGALGVARRAVRFLTHHDPLTGLPNRALFRDGLADALADARRYGRNVGVVLLDVDRFKRINDTYGRAEGDRVIRVCAHRLRRCARVGDLVARIGGDSFAVGMPGVQRVDEVNAMVQRLREALDEPIFVENLELRLTASFGISFAPRDGESPDQLLGNADMAMYRAKRAGPGESAFFEPALQRAATERLRLEHELRDAIAAGALHVAYQPILDARTLAVEAVEALVRWPRSHTVTPPAHFIPLAEETGLIVPLGEFVLREAARAVSQLHRAGFPELRLAVNLSRRQLNDPRLPELVQGALRDSGMPARLLELEITETFLATDPEHAAALLHALTGLGIRIALDDFGTGYSALALLRQFPVHQLKLDRSFVTDIAHNEMTHAIATAIFELARALRVRSLAEGVETEAQVRALSALGCDAFQGFYFARPMKIASLRRYLEAEISRGAKGPTPPSRR